jgi:ornithine cyclodeaminase/alanine dehydrogenase-like protein (mu-crystallin family)
LIPQRPDEGTLFKLNGLAIEDVATAFKVFD